MPNTQRTHKPHKPQGNESFATQRLLASFSRTEDEARRKNQRGRLHLRRLAFFALVTPQQAPVKTCRRVHYDKDTPFYAFIQCRGLCGRGFSVLPPDKLSPPRQLPQFCARSHMPNVHPMPTHKHTQASNVMAMEQVRKELLAALGSKVRFVFPPSISLSLGRTIIIAPCV